MISHWGGLLEYYENSLSSFAAAKQLGLYGVELDVWCTKDG